MSKNITIGGQTFNNVETIKAPLASDPIQQATFTEGGIIPSGRIEIQSNGETNVTNYAYANVNVQPTLQNKEVTPSTETQIIMADSGYYGLDAVEVNAVTSAIDANITAGNIKNNVSILGVTGTLQEGITPTGNINITSTSQTDVTNYATAQVVDANLVAGNIKKDTSILGVTGTYEGSGGASISGGYTLNIITDDVADFLVLGTGTSQGVYGWHLYSIEGNSSPTAINASIVVFLSYTGNLSATVTANSLCNYVGTNIVTGGINTTNSLFQNVGKILFLKSNCTITLTT